MEKKTTGAVTVFDINRYRIEDGPGIRTIIFFKGCPLRCKWCSNPFGLSPQVQLAYNEKKCASSGCENYQPGKAERGEHDAGGFCILPETGECIYGGRSLIGEILTPHEIMREIKKDALFYRRDGGGVTLSGGEVLLQAEGAAQILALCRRELLNTAVETSAYAPWEKLAGLLPLTDLLFVDLKHIDSAEHKRLTGFGNDLILGNIKKIAEYVNSHGHPELVLRLPVIPGLNSDCETMRRTAWFIAQLHGTVRVNLLPYHRLGADKYKMIGLENELYDLPGLDRHDPVMHNYKRCIEEIALNASCTIGGGDI